MSHSGDLQGAPLSPLLSNQSGDRPCTSLSMALRRLLRPHQLPCPQRRLRAIHGCKLTVSVLDCSYPVSSEYLYSWVKYTSSKYRRMKSLVWGKAKCLRWKIIINGIGRIIQGLVAQKVRIYNITANRIKFWTGSLEDFWNYRESKLYCNVWDRMRKWQSTGRKPGLSK